jgi:hypothetical protein
MILNLGVAINVHESFRDTLEIATLLDKAGIDQLWIVDFPAPRYAPPIASKIASITSCKIGIGLLSPILYDSSHIIRWIESLIGEHGKRFDLLIGPGDKSALRRIGMRNWVPNEIATRTITEAVRIREVAIEKEMDCDILLGAQGPRMIRESIRLDGVLLNLSEPEMIQRAHGLLDVLPKSFRFGVFFPSEVLDSATQGPSLELQYSAAIVALGAPNSLLQEFDMLDEIESARDLLRLKPRLDSEVIQAIGLDKLKKWGISLTPDRLVDYLSGLMKIGVSSVIFGPPISHKKASVKLLADSLGSV